MTAPAVSIIVPYFNPGVFLREAIESVLAQTFTDWELILVNDGSTDGTCRVGMSACADRSPFSLTRYTSSAPLNLQHRGQYELWSLHPRCRTTALGAYLACTPARYRRSPNSISSSDRIRASNPPIFSNNSRRIEQFNPNHVDCSASAPIELSKGEPPSAGITSDNSRSQARCSNSSVFETNGVCRSSTILPNTTVGWPLAA